MSWNDAIFQVISLHTFSNVWYWLAVAVSWSTTSQWVLGVPFDLIIRARRKGGDASDDLETMVGINVRRITSIVDAAGLWIMGFLAFVLSALGMAGFYYGFELAQGVFCLALPLSIAGGLTVRLCRAFAVDQPEGAELVRRLLRFRFWIQVLAMVSIFVTAMYGMYHNLSLPLGY